MLQDALSYSRVSKSILSPLLNIQGAFCKILLFKEITHGRCKTLNLPDLVTFTEKTLNTLHLP